MYKRTNELLEREIKFNAVAIQTEKDSATARETRLNEKITFLETKKQALQSDFDDLKEVKHNWQVVALSAIIALLLLIGFMIFKSRLARFLPFLIAFASIAQAQGPDYKPPVSINKQKGVIQTIVLDSTANKFGIESANDKHTIKIKPYSWSNIISIPTNILYGSGTNYYLSKFSGPYSQIQSQVYDNGTSVGIGTAVPSSVNKLEIAGTTHSTSIRGGSLSSYVQLQNYFGTSPRINTSGTSLDIAFGSNLYFYSTGDLQRMRLDATGLKIGTGSASSTLDIAGTGNISGDFTFGSNANIATAPTSGNHATNKTYVDTKQSGDGDLTALAALSGTGVAKRTGTNTWTVGAIGFSDVTNLQSTFDTKADTSGIRGLTSYVPVFIGTRQIRAGSIYDNGTRIGLGTNSPGYRLDVAGDVRVNGGSAMRFWRSDNATQGLFIVANSANNFITASNGGIIINTSTGTGNSINFDSGEHIGFRDAIGNYFIRVLSTGNVGIGVSSPTSKLDVNGTGHFVQNVTFDANAIIATAPSAGTHAANKTYVDTKQPLDADLTAISALSGTGVAKRTGTDTWSVGALIISDVTSLQSSLDAKQAIDADLTAISALSGTGVPRRTGTDTWSVSPLIISDVTSLQSSLDAKQNADGDLTAISGLSGTGVPKRTGVDTWALGTVNISDVASLQAALDAKLDTSATRGTTNYLSKFSATRQIRNSQIFDNGTSVGINTNIPDSGYKLDVNGTVKSTGFNIGGASSYGLDIAMYPIAQNMAQISTSANTLQTFAFQNFLWNYVSGMSVVQRMKLDATGLKIGTGSAAYALDVTGTGNFSTSAATPKILGSGSAPTISAGTGAGTSPTVSISGTDVAGAITITAGTSPVSAGDVVTVTFNSAYANAPYITFVEASDASYDVTNMVSTTTPANSFYLTAIGTGSFKLKMKTNRALIAGQAYVIHYHVLGRI
ncbi:hypothetical protein GCM10027442_38960 [Emticicia fontis]